MNGKMVVSTLALILALSILMGAVKADFGIEPPSDVVEVKGELSFSFDPDSGVIKGISFMNNTVIDEVRLPKGIFTVPDTGNISGYIRTEDYDIIYSSYPEPILTIKASGEIRCGIAIPGERISPGEKVQRFKIEGVEVSLVTDGFIDDRGTVILMEGEVLVFRFSHEGFSDVSDAGDAIKNAISLSNVGAEVSIDGLNFTSMEYDGVRIRPIRMSEKKMSFLVSSNETRGRCIVFRMNATMANISVLLDGEKIREGSYYDALFSMGDYAVWNSTVSRNGTTVYVYVPHFSNHTITIEEVQQSEYVTTVEPEPSMAIPVILAVMITSGALLAVIRRKR